MKPTPHHPIARRRKRTGALFAGLLAASAVSLGAAEKPQPPAKERAAATVKEIVLPVHGMTCAACVAVVKRGLSRTRGVTAVDVDLEGRNARISFDPQRVSTKQLAATVDKLGYKAGEPKDAPAQPAK